MIYVVSMMSVCVICMIYITYMTMRWGRMTQNFLTANIYSTVINETIMKGIGTLAMTAPDELGSVFSIQDSVAIVANVNQ
jgi:hypothetical protein